MLRPATTHATLTAKAAVTQTLIGIRTLAVISDPVADAAHRLDRRLSERAVDLLAQRAHIDIHDTRITVIGGIPYVPDQPEPGQDLAAMPHEVLEQRELGSRQADLGVAAPDPMGRRIQRQVSGPQDGRPGDRAPADQR